MTRGRWLLAGAVLLGVAAGVYGMARGPAAPDAGRAQVGYRVTIANQRTHEPFNPYATILDVTLAHWPEGYDGNRYQVLLLFTTTRAKVVDIASASPAIAYGGWASPQTIDAGLRALRLATLPGGVKPHGVAETWFLVAQPALQFQVTAFTNHAIPARDWRVVVMTILGANGKTYVVGARSVTPSRRQQGAS